MAKVDQLSPKLSRRLFNAYFYACLPDMKRRGEGCVPFEDFQNLPPKAMMCYRTVGPKTMKELKQLQMKMPPPDPLWDAWAEECPALCTGGGHH